MRRKNNPSLSHNEAINWLKRIRQPKSAPGHRFSDTQMVMFLAQTGLFPIDVSRPIVNRLEDLVNREMDGYEIDYNEVREHRSYLMGFLRCKLSFDDYVEIEAQV